MLVGLICTLSKGLSNLFLCTVNREFRCTRKALIFSRSVCERSTTLKIRRDDIKGVLIGQIKRKSTYVDFLVRAEVSTLSEVLATDVTLERLLAGVAAQMDFESA